MYTVETNTGNTYETPSLIHAMRELQKKQATATLLDITTSDIYRMYEKWRVTTPSGTHFMYSDCEKVEASGLLTDEEFEMEIDDLEREIRSKEMALKEFQDFENQ